MPVVLHSRTIAGKRVITGIEQSQDDKRNYWRLFPPLILWRIHRHRRGEVGVSVLGAGSPLLQQLNK